MVLGLGGCLGTTAFPVLLFVSEIAGLVGDAAHEVRVESDPVAPQAQVITQQEAPGFAPHALAQGQAINDGGADDRTAWLW